MDGARKRHSTSTTQSEYISIDEAARVLGIAKPTLYNWICLRKIGKEHGFRKIGRLVKFQRVALIAAIEAGTIR
jgi:excisionase family DNA binding protein